MSAAVTIRRADSFSSGSESSSGEERVEGKVRSAVIMPVRKKRSSRSPTSSLSRTPSPLPHATFHPPRRPWRYSPSPPPPPSAAKRQRTYSPRRRHYSPGERHLEDEVEEGELKEKTPPPKKKKEDFDPLLTRTGGAYIPPAKLRLMQQQVEDKSSVAYQRLAWEALKKSINGLINKVNVSNIGFIVQELFQENVVRARGLLVRSILQAQAASPTFTHVYAALVSIINTKFPQIGELLAKRLILQFKKSFRRNDKGVCVTASRFIAHLVNQLVLHEIVALELLTLLLEEPTDDSVEVSIGFLKECGLKLIDVSNRGFVAVFETLRSVLNSGQVAPRVQYMIEVMFAIRKDNFKEHPIVIKELDLVEEDDQITHLLSLGDSYEGEEILNVFQPDDDYLEKEAKYKEIKAEILGERSSDSEESSGDESGDEDSEDEEGEEELEKMDITDKTDAKALSLRRTIYLTIMSSLDYEECAHKLMKTKEEGQEPEIAMMLVECCSQERSYLRFFGLLGQKFCMLNRVWVEVFDDLFQEHYATVHRLETNKLRNIAKFFAQLFYCDALPWTGMSCMHLNEEETNSSSRIFVKIMFQELAEFMGIAKLNERLRDPVLAEAFEGLLPRDNPKNTRFAINFFTSIGLGGLTDDLREHLKNVQKQIMAQKQEVSSSDTSSSSDSQSDSDSSGSDSSSEDSSSEESSEESVSEKEERRKGRGRREKEKEEKEEEERERKTRRPRDVEKGRDRRSKENEREGGEERRRDERRRGDDKERRRRDERRRDDDKERKRDEDRGMERRREEDRGEERRRRRDRDGGTERKRKEEDGGKEMKRREEKEERDEREGEKSKRNKMRKEERSPEEEEEEEEKPKLREERRRHDRRHSPPPVEEEEEEDKERDTRRRRGKERVPEEEEERRGRRREERKTVEEEEGRRAGRREEEREVKEEEGRNRRRRRDEQKGGKGDEEEEGEKEGRRERRKDTEIDRRGRREERRKAKEEEEGEGRRERKRKEREDDHKRDEDGERLSRSDRRGRQEERGRGGEENRRGRRERRRNEGREGSKSPPRRTD